MSLDQKQLAKLLSETPKPITGKAKFLRAYFYGQPKVGKTTLAATSGRQTLHLTSGDDGEDALFAERTKEILPLVDTLKVEGFTHLMAIAHAISQGMDDWAKYQNGVIIIDTVSGVVSNFLRNMVENYKSPKSDRVVFTNKADSTDSITIVGMSEYGASSNKMIDLVNVMHAIPADVIWLAWEKEPGVMAQQQAQNGQWQALQLKPEVPKRTSDPIESGVHLIGHFTKTGSKRELNFTGDRKRIAGSRIDTFNDKTINVDDFWTMINKWRET